RRGEHPADPARRRHLVREARAEVGLPGELAPDRLDRDEPPRRRPAEVDPAHRPGPEPAQKRVGADPPGIATGQRLDAGAPWPPPPNALPLNRTIGIILLIRPEMSAIGKFAGDRVARRSPTWYRTPSRRSPIPSRARPASRRSVSCFHQNPPIY